MKIIEEILGEGEVPFTAETFLNYLRRSAPHWWMSDNQDECGWVFRGHRDASWKLVPSAARPFTQLDPNFQKVIERLESSVKKSKPDNWVLDASQTPTLRYWGVYKCLSSFMRLAHSLSYPIHGMPECNNVLAELDNKRLEYNHFIGDEHASTISETIALAQHHGVPTFFLDWSENPVTSCYFAVQDAESDIAVWALNAKLIERRYIYHMEDLVSQKSSGILHLIRPSAFQNEYLSAQKGLMTFLSGGAMKTWQEKGEYPAMEDWVRPLDPVNLREKLLEIEKSGHASLDHYRNQFEAFIANGEPLLRKIVLKSEHVLHLKALLYREGVSKAHLMPSLDNVAKTALVSLAEDI